MEAFFSSGFQELAKLGVVVAILTMVIVGLCWFIRELLLDAKNERKLNRDALIHATEVLSEFKELIQSALRNR